MEGAMIRTTWGMLRFSKFSAEKGSSAPPRIRAHPVRIYTYIGRYFRAHLGGNKNPRVYNGEVPGLTFLELSKVQDDSDSN